MHCTANGYDAPLVPAYNRSSSVFVRGLAVVLGMLAPSVYAADTGSNDLRESQIPVEDETLAEVVVTAEKRSSTVQKTPLSVTALSGEELQKSGITAAQGIAQAVPGIAVASAGPGQAQYEIRGMSADGGESPTVGFYLDEIPITPPAAATTGKNAVDPDLYDLSRVEVLRGPQGTLYGSGSMGGTVKLVTNPADTSGFYGSAQSNFSTTPSGKLGYGQKAMLNLPLSPDTVALRIVGTYSHTAGWIDRVVVPDFPLESNPGANLFGTTRGVVTNIPGSTVFKDVNDTNLTGARASLLFTPTGQFSITPSVLYQEIRQGGMNAYDSSPGTAAHYQPFDIAEPFSDRFTLYSLKLEYTGPDLDVTSATGYWTRRSSQAQDASEATQNAFQLPAYSVAGGLGLGAAAAFEVDSTRQFTQELRLASTDDTAVQWIAGAFYSLYHYTLLTGENAPGIASLTGTPFATTNVFYVDQPFTVRQTAFFGNINYRFNEQLKLTLGARHFAFHSRVNSSDSGIASPSGSDTPTLASASASATGWNPMANLAYTVKPDLMYYASAAKGFREGAGNFPIPTTGPVGSVCLQNLETFGRTSAPLMYQPDTVWSYELGEKARLFDQRLTLNTAVYYMRWSKVQEPIALGCGLAFTDNAAQAEVEGGELELHAALPLHFSLTQSVGLTHAVFTQDSPEAGIVKGQSLLNVPRWTISTQLGYERALSSGLRVTATGTNSYVSSSRDLTYSLNTLPARDLVGIRFGVAGKTWSASLYADNLLDRRYALEYLNLLSFTGPPYNRVAENAPRVVGLEFNVDFGLHR